MFPDHIKLKEAAHIGEELFDDNSYELERSCLSLQKGVERKLFTLDVGLRTYGITREQYEEYLAKDIAKILNVNFPANKSLSDQVSTIHVLERIFPLLSSFSFPQNNLIAIRRVLERLSKEVEKAYTHDSH